jgi:hypothetical protein
MLFDAARALLLLVLANSLPWAAARLLEDRWAAPLDLGLTLPDGERLLGSHKTWRGIIVAACGCALAAALCGLRWWTGAEFAVLALLGDALSSLCKRRLSIAPGLGAPLLDQLPESLTPLIALRTPLALDSGGIATVTCLFTLLGILATALRRHVTARAVGG